MGLLDVFKTKNKRKVEEGDRIFDLACAAFHYEEVKQNYTTYKEALVKLDFNEEKIIFNTIGVILQFLLNNKIREALQLFKHLELEHPNHHDINWLFIEIICTLHITYDRSTAKTLLDQKIRKNTISHHYKKEYEKAIELKKNEYYREAIEIWNALNKIKPSALNYYQIGITQYIVKDEKYIDNFEKAIGIDSLIRKKIINTPELNSIKNDKAFLQMLL